MLNKKLGYLLSNDPLDTVSKKGVEIRKKIRPLLLFLLKLSNKQKLTVEKCYFNADYEKRPVVYVCSHGFKDDCQNMLISAKPDGYLIFGNIDLFFNTFDGTIAWAYGSQLINRFDKASRQAMYGKMDRLFECGTGVIIFPEATWNMSPNKPMLGLHWGFYDAAIKNNAVIVPILTHKVGNRCYSRILPKIDPKEVWKKEINSIYLKMKQYLDKAKDILMYHSQEADMFRECFDFLDKEIDKLEKNIKRLQIIKDMSLSSVSYQSIRERETFDKSINAAYKEIDANIDEIEIIAQHYQMFFKVALDREDDSIEFSAYLLISKLISRIGTARKEVVVKHVRDIMALEKVDMYREHPDTSYMDENTDMYEAWDKYIDDTLKGTPYFYPEEEKSTEFKDPLIADIDEVMPWLKDKQKELK